MSMSAYVLLVCLFAALGGVLGSVLSSTLIPYLTDIVRRNATVRIRVYRQPPAEPQNGRVWAPSDGFDTRGPRGG